MKITIIAKEFPKTSETFVLSQARGLLNSGLDVRVVSVRQPREAVPSDFYGRTAYLGKPRITGFLKNLFPGAGLNGKKTALEFIGNADIILVHYGDLAYSLLDKLENVNAPLAVVFHGVDVARHLPALPLKERQKLWDRISLGLPVSNFFRDKLIGLGCSPEKLTVHHMGIDIKRFAYRKKIPESGSLKLLSVCRLVEKKGLDIAVKAIAELLKENPGIKLFYNIIGDGPERKRLEEIAKSLGIGDKIHFHGSMGQDKIKGFLENSDIFILPSRTSANGDMEGIPVSLMEAMSCGLTVVSTFHSGIPELVENGVSGVLVPENDSETLASAIIKLARNPEKIISLGENARKKIESDFNLEILNTKLEKILLTLA